MVSPSVNKNGNVECENIFTKKAAADFSVAASGTGKPKSSAVYIYM